MYLDLLDSAGPNTDLITTSATSALLWEQLLTSRQAQDRGSAWPSPAIQSFPAWLQEQFETLQAESPALRDRSLLSSHQTSRLWLQILEDSPAGQSLIGAHGLARWARAAAAALYGHGVSPQELGPEQWTGDSAALQRWHRQYEARLRNSGWIDRDQILYLLNRLPAPQRARDVVLLDPPEHTPETELLCRRWRALGKRMDSVRPDDCRAVTRSLAAANLEGELRHAAVWARSVLAQKAESRVAVVIPELTRRRDEIEDAFQSYADVPMSFPRGRPITATGLFGSALSALEILTPESGFGAVSRWLRSACFFESSTGFRDRAARMERRLRREPRLQRCFATAYKRFGLRSEFQRHLPELAKGLDAAFARLPHAATPTGWSQHWQACLRLLEWNGFAAELSDSLRSSWDSAWARFAELTSITGTLEAAAALREFEQVLSQVSVFEPVSLSGVHFLDSLAAVGPGYSGAWIGGFSDRAWPDRLPSNPLLPRSLRQRLGMPGTNPLRDLAQADIALGRLFARVPEAVFSCPLRVLDQPQIPNRRFSNWPVAADAVLPGNPIRSVQAPARAAEIIEDPAPALVSDSIRGGVRVLDLQSACPVRAFAAVRLGAEPLEVPVRGVDARLRGILLHRTLELLFAHEGANDRLQQLAGCVSQAAMDMLPVGDVNWNTLVEAERVRAQRLVRKLLELDERRAAFAVVAREEPGNIVLSGKRFRCRIDRIDAVAGGQRILLDYKTGLGSVSDWFRDRLGNVQLPLYALISEVPADAIAIVTLNDRDVSYRAAGPSAGALPGRQQAFDHAAWLEQLASWRSQLETLAAEFAGGDVRIRLAAAELADGPYAALTRIREFER